MGDETTLKTKSEKRKTKKFELLIATAKKVFLEQGYDRASMDLIATAAGVSKATLYVYFENKEALLFALISQECKHIGLDPLLDLGQSTADIQAALRRIARNFTKLFLSESSLGLYQLVMANASHFPEITEVFMNAGPRKQQKEVAAFLNQAIHEGSLEIENVDLAVKQFLSLVQGDLPLNWALSMKRPEQSEYDALIEGGVRVFLAAYGKKQRKPEVMKTN
ncbi:TetR/AcrR family transcriptional regulator [Rhizobium sp.]|jgi:TetR/AcrR family transcriptional regulator, mexJK operon transcriptional repressor|uniref:TetR/AcrR family transcriptional regulator n=1 Tax=Rhizobium sp. TaxID=391 RepID=UPI000E88AEF8|nr:TetR family transcriptional regulator [Rhizobium sp.]